MAGGRVRGATGRRELPRPSRRGGRHLPEQPAVRSGIATTRCWRSACRSCARCRRTARPRSSSRPDTASRSRPSCGRRAWPVRSRRPRRRRVTVTLLACHAVPRGMAREDWVRVACDELIPAAAAEQLIDQVDIYVEDIAFSLGDLELVAAAAEQVEMPLRVHADQLGPSGAAEVAVAVGARSADHLNHLSAAGVEALGAAAGTVAVLLPASSFLLGGASAAGDGAPRRECGARHRDRLQPGHVARLLDARGDRVGAAPPTGSHRWRRSPRRPRTRRWSWAWTIGPRDAGAGQAGRLPAPGGSLVRAGPVPAGPRSRRRDHRRRRALT